MNVITDAKQINLNSNSADSFNNGLLKSDLRFNIPYLIRKDKSILYNTIKLLHAEIPYSFYIINEYNNKLVLSTGIIEFEYGNYNANTFMKMIQPLLHVNMHISFNTSNGKFTISHNQPFTIYNTSTCQLLLGFDSTLYSDNGNIVMPYQANFLGTKNLYIKTTNLVLENYNTNTKDYITLFTIPVNTVPYGIIMYDNISGSKNYVKNSNSINYLDLVITDDYNNQIDFNNTDWSITIEVESTIEVIQNKQTINEYLNDIYNSNLPEEK